MTYPPLIVILGPTASGKSELALELASEINGEIISADSRQIYKYLDIGTAKPSLYERNLIPHHLVDIIEIEDDFTINDFEPMALEAIYKVYNKGNRPILVGGSGLYIKAVTDGIELPVTPPDYELRAGMKEIAIKKGTKYLHDMLTGIDPLSAARIHLNDLNRIIRAIEVFEKTSVPLSTFQTRRKKVPFDILKIGINWPRELLYDRIERRVDEMFKMGLIEEVKSFICRGYSFGQPPLDALGYPETADYLKGKTTLSETIRLIKRNTRKFSKRQMTWFRKDKEIFWLEPEPMFDIKKMKEQIKFFLEGK